MGGSSSINTRPPEKESEKRWLSPSAQFKTVTKDHNVLIAYIDGETPFLVLISRNAKWGQNTSEIIALRSDGNFIRVSHSKSDNQIIERFETIHVSKLKGFFRAVNNYGARVTREKRKTAHGIEASWRVVSAKKRRNRRLDAKKKTA